MNPEQIVVLVSVLAVSIAEGRSEDELSLLGAVFSQLGDSLATIVAARGLSEHDGKKAQIKNTPDNE